MTGSVTTILSVLGAVLVSCSSYLFAKWRERDAELRKEKLDHYKAFISSLSGIMDGESTPEGQRNFSRASNNLNCFAPLEVLQALYKYGEGTSSKKTSSRETQSDRQQRHDQLLSALLQEIRKDLKVSKRNKDVSFTFHLRNSGTPPREQQPENHSKQQ